MAKGKYKRWLEEDSLILLEGWARDGLSDEQLADKMGISPSTYYTWIGKYDEISEAIKKGKAPVDYKVENAMLKSALGYYVTVRKPIKVKTEKQKDKMKIIEERIEYVDEQIYIAPQSANQFFWLKNRMANKWKDHPESADTTAVDVLKEILDETRRRAEREAK